MTKYQDAAPVHAGASRFRGKAWLLLTVPLGFTTFAAFLYIGIRARRPRWLAWAAVYAATLAGFLVLDAPDHPNPTAMGVATVLALGTWIGGGVHALVVSNDAVRRIQGSEDPAIEAAETRIERRAAGRRLLASKPALAHEVGVGRPDIPARTTTAWLTSTTARRPRWPGCPASAPTWPSGSSASASRPAGSPRPRTSGCCSTCRRPPSTGSGTRRSSCRTDRGRSVCDGWRTHDESMWWVPTATILSAERCLVIGWTASL